MFKFLILFLLIIFYNFLQEFLLCRTEEKDPRKCLNEGKELTACAFEFFRKVKANCTEEFTQYANCIDKSSCKFDITK